MQILIQLIIGAVATVSANYSVNAGSITCNSQQFTKDQIIQIMDKFGWQPGENGIPTCDATDLGPGWADVNTWTFSTSEQQMEVPCREWKNNSNQLHCYWGCAAYATSDGWIRCTTP
ncbi:hypothetical protein PYCC9005_001805 [Savitreella phatthalungensis]